MNSKTKRALKGIVKECLIEILAEGLVGNQQATLSEARELRGTLHEAYDNAPKRRTISERSISMPTQSSSRTSTSSGKRASYLDSIKSFLSLCLFWFQVAFSGIACHKQFF